MTRELFNVQQEVYTQCIVSQYFFVSFCFLYVIAVNPISIVP